MTTTLAFIVSLISGVAGLTAGLKRNIEGIPLVLVVAAAMLVGFIATYIAVIGVLTVAFVAILAVKLLLVAAVIVGIYYAAQWLRSRLAH
jgi:hypothetical protein